MKLFAALAVMLVFFSCSTPIEKTAYETIVGAKAFTDKTKQQHPECATGTVSSVCTALSKAISAKDAVIDAAEIACAGPNFNAGGACDFPAKGTPAYSQAITKIQAAIDSYNQTATDLKNAL